MTEGVGKSAGLTQSMVALLNHAYSARRRVRHALVLQREVAECGLACGATIARYFGHRVDMAWMRERFGTSIKGANLARIKDVLAELGIDTRPLRVNVAWFATATNPAVLHWEGKHFVVYLRQSRGHVLIADPAWGLRWLTMAELSAGFSGVLLEATVGGKFEPRALVKPLEIAPLLRSLDGFKAKFLQYLGLVFAVEGLGLALPLQMQWTVDQSHRIAGIGTLPAITAGFGLVVVVQSSLSWLKGWLMGGLAPALNEDWTRRLTHHLLKLPIAFFARRHIGDVASKFISLRIIQMYLTSGAVEALLNGLFGMLALVALAKYSGEMALAVGVVMVLYAMGRKVALQRVQRLSAQQVRTAALQQTELVETIQGMESIQLAGMQERRAERMRILALQIAQQERSLMRTNSAVAAVGQGVPGLLRVGLISWGTVLLQRGFFSPGMLVAAVAYAEVFNSRVTTFVDRLMESFLLKVHGEEVADIAQATPARHQDGGDGLPEGPLDIEIVDLGFRYSYDEPWVLRHFHARIAAGESVAFCGPSGCGKSTLARLVLGLLEPTEGEIRVGGVNILNAGLTHYRRRLAAVLQDDCLFTGSIADNISFFAPNASDAAIRSAARLAAIDSEIEGMPMRYLTAVGEQGSGLSGGQRQRILLARALYRCPQLLVLDEATSSLDAANEVAISRSVRSLPMTRLMIAHRQETLATADRVIDLSLQQVAETCFP